MRRHCSNSCGLKMKKDNPGLQSAEHMFRRLAAVEQVGIALKTTIDADTFPPDRPRPEWVAGERGQPVADAPAAIYATPFVYRDPSKIPLRQYLYGKVLIRKFVSMVIG